MRLKEWTSEGRALYSSGMECCIVLGWRDLFSSAPYGIRRENFKGKGAV